MQKRVEILGIDHGYRNMKTSHICFPSAIHEINEKPAILDDVLEFQGKYYNASGENIVAVDIHDKTASKEFYLLTLVAIARELKYRNVSVKDTTIRIAAGLPQQWYMAQMKEFKHMLKQNQTVNFNFEGVHYKVVLEDANVYMQGISACLEYMQKFPYFIIVDIGGETMDVIPVKNGKPDESNCSISTLGMIWLYKHVKDCVRTELLNEVPETYIENYIKTSKKEKKENNNYEKIIKRVLMDYTNTIMTSLREKKFNLDLTPVVFVGGGEEVIRNFGNYNADITYFIDDICSNAKGYERCERVVYTTRQKGRK